MIVYLPMLNQLAHQPALKNGGSQFNYFFMFVTSGLSTSGFDDSFFTCCFGTACILGKTMLYLK